MLLRHISSLARASPPVGALSTSGSALVKVVPAAAKAPGEQDIRELFPVAIDRTARITGRVERQAGFRHGLIRALGRLQKHRTLWFRVETDVPWPYDVYWKVRNFGPEAERVNGLRGQLVRATNPRAEHRESTLYTGSHYIDAYVVKDGVVRATDRHRVDIA